MKFVYELHRDDGGNVLCSICLFPCFFLDRVCADCKGRISRGTMNRKHSVLLEWDKQIAENGRKNEKS